MVLPWGLIHKIVAPPLEQRVRYEMTRKGTRVLLKFVYAWLKGDACVCLEGMIRYDWCHRSIDLDEDDWIFIMYNIQGRYYTIKYSWLFTDSAFLPRMRILRLSCSVL